MDDGKCYLCRKHFYGFDHKCPGCGAHEPRFREMSIDVTMTKDGVKFSDVKYRYDAEHDQVVKQEPDYGYHRREIKKGELGKVSKISEEYEEFLDAKEQDNPVMELVELSDLLGAVEAYTKKKYNLTLEDLIAMTRATQRAFQNGHRK